MAISRKFRINIMGESEVVVHVAPRPRMTWLYPTIPIKIVEFPGADPPDMLSILYGTIRFTRFAEQLRIAERQATRESQNGFPARIRDPPDRVAFAGCASERLWRIIMLSIFNKRGTYTVEKLEADGSTAVLTIKGVRPDALTVDAFRAAAGKPGAEVEVKQSIGKLKENGIRISAKQKELYGSNAVAAADAMFANMLPAHKSEGVLEEQDA